MPHVLHRTPDELHENLKWPELWTELTSSSAHTKYFSSIFNFSFTLKLTGWARVQVSAGYTAVKLRCNSLYQRKISTSPSAKLLCCCWWIQQRATLVVLFFVLLCFSPILTISLNATVVRVLKEVGTWFLLHPKPSYLYSITISTAYVRKQKRRTYVK